jgi:hypothetical protein
MQESTNLRHVRRPPSVAAKFPSVERAREAVAALNTRGIDVEDIALVGAVSDPQPRHRSRRRGRHRRENVFSVPVAPAGAVWLAVFDASPVAQDALAACQPLDLRRS